MAQLGLSVRKSSDFNTWYSQVITKSEMIEYYNDVSGCYILRPWSFEIWELIQEFPGAELKKLGVKNAYFPLLHTEEALTKEKNHVEGFAPEVAWVTKTGNTELEKALAIRSTSETIIYPIFAKWIRSYRDLPLRINQWCNVVRWEFKDPTPLIRSREFLWQEGHTAFATKEEADEEVLAILDVYRRVYEELLAVPVIKGVKSELEKFAGSLYTTTVEAFVPQTGRGVQGATSHCLGQIFAEIFDISYENADQKHEKVWQNSWGLTTRSIGVMVMLHGDDRGVILPPRVAPVQIVIIAISVSTAAGSHSHALEHRDATNRAIIEECRQIAQRLRDAGMRVEEDYRTNYTPGWKQAKIVRRDNTATSFLSLESENITAITKDLLDDIQRKLLEKAREDRDSRDWDDFIAALEGKKMALAPWCDEVEVEEIVKEKTRSTEHGAAKTLRLPFEQPDLAEDSICLASGKPAKKWALWGRSY